MITKRIPGAFLALALLGLFCGSALGQETKELTLTLEDSIVRALKNNLNVAAEVINPGLASASVSMARQMYTPTLQFDLSGNRYEQASTGPFQANETYINKGDELVRVDRPEDPLRRHLAGLPELRLLEEQPALPELQSLLSRAG